MESVKIIELEKTKPSGGFRPIGHCHSAVCRKNSQPIWCWAASPIINQSRFCGLRIPPPVSATKASDPNNTDCAARLIINLFKNVTKLLRMNILWCDYHKAVKVINRSTFNFIGSIQRQQDRREGIWRIIGKYVEGVRREIIILDL